MLQLHNSSWEPKKALFTGGSATTPAFILAKTETRRCVIRWPTLPRRAGTRLQLPCRHSNSSVIKLLVTNQGRYVMGVDRNSFGLGLHMLAKPHGGVAVTRTATRVAGFAVVGELAKEVRDSSLRDEMADELVSRGLAQSRADVGALDRPGTTVLLYVVSRSPAHFANMPPAGKKANLMLALPNASWDAGINSKGPLQPGSQLWLSYNDLALNNKVNKERAKKKADRPPMHQAREDMRARMQMVRNGITKRAPVHKKVAAPQRVMCRVGRRRESIGVLRCGRDS